ncbi:MAG: hypothetical protein LBN03_01055, partial [Bifidobacteriaceae bacterium]|nr:hypothetical protein [Bifidobacteriaceae bacterium]
DGVTVGWATLHNFDWLIERDVRIGSEVIVKRANEVIPYLVAVTHNPSNTVPFEIINNCPLCGAVLNKDTLLWACPNLECESRIDKALIQAVGRNYLNIDSLSTETINRLIDSNLVKNIADLYSLSFEDWASLELGRDNIKGEPILLGSVVAAKIIKSLETAKEIPLYKILASLNIPGLGTGVAKNLVRHFKTIDNIFEAEISDFDLVDLVSDKRSAVIKEAILNKKDLILRLKEIGFIALNDNNVDERSFEYGTVLDGEIVVISGEIPGYNREEAKDFIESLGAKTSGSVSSKTTLLISDPESTTSKVMKAKELGVRIIGAEEFLESIVGG